MFLYVFSGSRKIRPPGKFPPIKPPLENSPRKIPNQKIPTQNIPTYFINCPSSLNTSFWQIFTNVKIRKLRGEIGQLAGENSVCTIITNTKLSTKKCYWFPRCVLLFPLLLLYYTIIQISAIVFTSQAFIQTLLSTAVFPQWFSFFTVCLVQYLREVPPMVGIKVKHFEIQVSSSLEMHFQHSFRPRKHSLYIVCLKWQ